MEPNPLKILIHAVPERMWYVNEFMVPELEAQGADLIQIFNDVEHLGNLEACLRAFESREDEGETWHLQDDVLICRDFVQRARAIESPVAYGFCCRNFGDRLDAWGRVYAPDAWNSFQCIKIPNAYARECAAWVRSGAWQKESKNHELAILHDIKQGDDTFFHEFMFSRHWDTVVENIRPNLVEHIDWMLGGSTIQKWRDYIARAEYWEDQELLDETKARIRARGVHS